MFIYLYIYLFVYFLFKYLFIKLCIIINIVDVQRLHQYYLLTIGLQHWGNYALACHRIRTWEFLATT